MSGRWVELAHGVLARRYPELDQTIGLVIGDGECLVVDTRANLVWGAELAAAVREVTTAPWTIALTHYHWDHCFGTAEFLPSAVWAHERCHAELLANGTAQRDKVAERYEAHDQPDLAELMRAVETVLPDRVMTDRAELSVGGRRVDLAYLGLGHTDNDIVVHVPDAGVVFAGDLVEQGAPPSFGDAHPLHWPGTVGGIIGLAPRVVSPGHGEPVDLDFVRAQQAELTLIGELCSEMVTDRCSMAAALARSPYPEDVLRTAVARVRTSRSDPPK